ncbi:hypothetical protein FRC04_004177 [Tulasnella sp. 424]|nr:hypothetical protein FRC04_004177 [Tulasnella sp. 424]
MVSMASSNALSDPTKVLQDLYTQQVSPGDFPAQATAHFDQLFATDDALQQIPVLNANPQDHASRSLVQFRGMVQDTMSPEIYLASVQDKGGRLLGGWGVADTMTIERPEDEVVDDYSNLKERFVLWVVSVPGESEWLRDMYTPHKLKATEIANFIGILTSEELSMPAFDSDASPPLVPTLHVLFTRSVPRTIISGYKFPMEIASPTTADNVDVVQAIESSRLEITKLRDELISWVAEEALGGDREAAEWVLLIATSRVQSRHPEIIPPSMTISAFPLPPSGSSPTPTPTLHHLLHLLLPSTTHLNFPVNLHSWDDPPPTKPGSLVHFAPHSENEDLHSGVLQLPAGTVLTILESDVRALPSKAAENLHILRNMLRTQTLQYKFPYAPGNGFEFQTDIPCIILCNGGKSGKSVFLPDNDVHVRLNVKGGQVYDAYKPSKDVVLPPTNKLESFRKLVGGTMIGTSKVTPDVAQYIQDDFVKERLEGASRSDGITPQDLMLRMNLVRYE